MPLSVDTNWFRKTLTKLGNQGLPASLNAAPLKILGINTTAADLLDSGDAGAEFLSEIAAGNRTHSIVALTSVVWANRVLDFADLVNAFTDPNNANGATAAIIIFWDTGVETTSPLIGYSRDAAGLPLSQDGLADNVTFNGTGFLRIDGV